MANHHHTACPTIIGLGEVLWDLLPEGKQFGGAPANVAYHARAMGAEAHVVSAVGDDDLGREILDSIDRLSLGRDFVAVDAEHPTGTVSVELDEHGQPDYTIHRPVAWDFIPSMTGLDDLARRTDAVAFGSLAQRSAVSRDTIVARYALELVALTKGKAGSVLQGPEARSVEPGRSVTVADTVGAGDSFTAAVVMGLLAGHELDAINRRAGEVAAYVCTQPGATPEMPGDLRSL